MIAWPLHAFAKTKSSSAKRPNILLVFCDDLGYADVGFNAEQFGVTTDVVTPNLDALAKNGTLCTQAYVAHPFCGPSRMGLLSGRMPHCFGGQKNLPDAAKNLADFNLKGIPESETMISSVLQDGGYRTGCIGKWHLGDAPPFHPNARGFGEFYGFLGGGHVYYPSLSDKVEPKINDYQYFLQRNGQKVRSPEGGYLTDTLSNEAVKFVSQADSKDEPFFLYLAYNAPHSPLQGKTEDLQKLYPNHSPSNPKNGVDFHDYERRQNYVAMVYAVDRGVGKIVDALQDPNQDGDRSDSIYEETLIVFLSDNGGKILQAANNAPLQDDKGSTHEGGIRVPMFVHWPNHVKMNTVYDHPIHSLDLYPTFCGLAGAAIPPSKKLDGKDVWDDFTNDRDAHSGETHFWLRHHGSGNEVAVRKGNLKAYRKNGGKWLVFDVASDLDESDNLASQQTSFLREAVSEGKKWSETLLVPQWHDTQAAIDQWNNNGMPKFESTFQLK